MSTIYTTAAEPFEESVAYQNENGTTKDITGHTSYIRVAKYYGVSSPVATIPGTIFGPAANGVFKYSSEDTSIWTGFYPGAHVYTRYLFDNTGKIVGVDNGTLILMPSVPTVPPPPAPPAPPAGP